MYNDFEIKRSVGGLINEPCPHPKDYVLGATVTPKVVHFPTGHGWLPYAPTKDYQVVSNGDLNICVTDSVVNGYEYAVEKLRKDDAEIDAWLKENGYIDENDNVKFNNRIVAVGSGTDPNAGNTVTNVTEFIRVYGLAPQSAYPWDNSITKEEFYKPLTEEIKNSGKKILEVINFFHEWLPHKPIMFAQDHLQTQLINGLKYGCLRVSVDGNYEQDNNGLIRASEREGKMYYWNHSVLIRDFKEDTYFDIHDHYNSQFLKFNWNYPFGNAKLLYVSSKKNLSGQFVDYGKSIFVYGLEGKYKNMPLGFEDGDVLKAIYGSYEKTKPRNHLNTPPENPKLIKIV